jgi:hypothetical protein
MDSHLRRLAARQQDVVAAWQLLDAGWSPDAVEYDLGEVAFFWHESKSVVVIELDAGDGLEMVGSIG